MTKQEAINELTRAADLCPTTPLAEACRMAVDALSGVAPTVDAVPVVHGRWIKMGHIEHTWFVSKCSVCGNQTFDAGTYCANCGARMDGKDGDNHD